MILHYGVLWYIIVDGGILRYMMVYYGRLWFIIVDYSKDYFRVLQR